ncbi:hypothetical protein Pmani_007008 [Petrolisthes manimaculis]|uniref:Uncharacterized protein n=1 Tax=Petrolisthes manimaculis TaxID=1843537 RepID=A0AAE1Q9T1_9EUCA|nr:hypothetical protein Pmani_007008 [Petrolisthes manimaculis]
MGARDELISHLTVNKARTRPPETVDDLVNADGWKWGIDALIWTGVPLEYFTRHKNPAVVEINKHMEDSTQQEGEEEEYEEREEEEIEEYEGRWDELEEYEGEEEEYEGKWDEEEYEEEINKEEVHKS